VNAQPQPIRTVDQLVQDLLDVQGEITAHTAPSCNLCGHIHTATDARAVGRFTGTTGYVASHAGTPLRATRAEAEADECTWRRNRQPETPAATIPQGEPVSRAVAAGPKPDPEPFPAVLMETAARAKAWVDFLVQIRMSLIVWEVDPEVRAGCEHVASWLRGLAAEMQQMTRAVE
jgi:cell division septation protein DedD